MDRFVKAASKAGKLCERLDCDCITLINCTPLQRQLYYSDVELGSFTQSIADDIRSPSINTQQNKRNNNNMRPSDYCYTQIVLRPSNIRLSA